MRHCFSESSHGHHLLSGYHATPRLLNIPVSKDSIRAGKGQDMPEVSYPRPSTASDVQPSYSGLSLAGMSGPGKIKAAGRQPFNLIRLF